jgi:hypothetical protein
MEVKRDMIMRRTSSRNGEPESIRILWSRLIFPSLHLVEVIDDSGSVTSAYSTKYGLTAERRFYEYVGTMYVSGWR